MSVIVSTQEAISRSATNTSPAKALYSFSKQPRFQSNIPINKTLSYDNKTLFKTPKNKNARRCTFGLSDRGNIFVTKESLKKPSALHYTLPTAFSPRDYVFERNKNPSQKSLNRTSIDTTFGVSRDAFDKVVGHDGSNHQPHDRTLPGPGFYQPVLVNAKDRYSMRKRTVKNRKFTLYLISSVFQINTAPGPGAYKTIAEIAKNEKQLIGSFQRTKSPAIKLRSYDKPSKHDRVPYYRDRPGPGYYSVN